MHTVLGQKSSLSWNWWELCLPHQQSHNFTLNIHYWYKLWLYSVHISSCPLSLSNLSLLWPLPQDKGGSQAEMHSTLPEWCLWQLQQAAIPLLLTLLLIILLLLHPENQDVQEMILNFRVQYAICNCTSSGLCMQGCQQAKHTMASPTWKIKGIFSMSDLTV